MHPYLLIIHSIVGEMLETFSECYIVRLLLVNCICVYLSLLLQKVEQEKLEKLARQVCPPSFFMFYDFRAVLDAILGRS